MRKKEKEYYQNKKYHCQSCGKEMSFGDWYECSICTPCICENIRKIKPKEDTNNE